MTARVMDRTHVELGLAPVADFAASAVSSDVVNMENYNRVTFYVIQGVGTTGTYKITVDACDDTTPSNTTAIPFSYRNMTAGASNGTATVTTAATGYTITAGSNQITEVEVAAEDLASTGYSYVRCTLTEVVDAAILGGILVVMSEPKYSSLTTTATT